MNPRDLTITYEQANLLKNYGVKQGTSYFVWVVSKIYKRGIKAPIPREIVDDGHEEILCDAFTLQELAWLLKPEIHDEISTTAKEECSMLLYILHKNKQRDEYFKRQTNSLQNTINSINKNLEEYAN